MRTQRDRDRIRKQQRRKKLRYLRQRLAQAENQMERDKLIAKIRRISRTAPLEQS